MKNNSKSLLLGLIVVLMLAACGETKNSGFATVNGKWHRKDPKVSFFKIVDGRVEELAQVSVQDDGRFGFMVPITQEDLYVIGTPDNQFRISRYAFYFKPGDQLNVEVNDTTYFLKGENTKENIEMARWHEEGIGGVEKNFYVNMQTHKSSSYKNFFPEVEKLGERLKTYEQKSTGNKLFDQRMEQYQYLDVMANLTGFLFTPRIVHPKVEQFPQFYRELDINRFVTDASAVLRYPFGSRVISQVLYLDKMLKGEKYQQHDYLTMLKNDTLIGEVELMGLSRIKSYAVYKEKMETAEKYMLTDDQKERTKQIKVKLGADSMEGEPVPNFKYPDVNGKMVSMADQKGKVVLIDVWATWCSPCKKEIPHLEKLEKEYHGKDIVFMSVSVDKEQDKQKWVDMVREKNMGGIQLFANGFGSEIAKFFGIRSIPRFLLIDKEGNIVSTAAPRPSNPELKEYIDKLLQ